jgi:lambda family phage portal protein
MSSLSRRQYNRYRAHRAPVKAQASYKSASTHYKNSTWKAILTSPRQDTDERVRTTITARAAEEYRDNPLATAAIDRPITHTVGTGLKANVNLNYKMLGISKEEAIEKNQEIEAEFDIWASSIYSDAELTTPFYAQQSIVMGQALLRGDCFVDTPFLDRGFSYDLALRIIEADRVSNPQHGMDEDKIAGGVEIDKNGAPKYYHIAKGHPCDSYVNSQPFTWERHKIFENGFRRILHIFKKQRGLRGVSVLANVLKPLKQIKELDDAELDAAVLNALFAVITKTKTGEGLDFPQQNFFGAAPQPPSVDKPEQAPIELASGLILNTIEGDEVISVDPKRPNINVNIFVNECYKRIAAGIGIPVEELLLYYNKSYSASRAAMLRAWEAYKVRRYWLAYTLCNPVYKLWFHEAVAKGKIKAPGYNDPHKREYWTQVNWDGPGKGSIDELKEALASSEKIKNGTSSIQIETRENKGLDYLRDIHEQRAIEVQKRREDGLEMDEKTKVSDVNDIVSNAQKEDEDEDGK